MPWVNRPANGSSMSRWPVFVMARAIEPRVEQMQDRMLDAADILVDRQPVVGRCGIDRRRRHAGGRSARNTRRNRRRCPWCRSRAARARRIGAGDMLPGRMMVERIAGLVEGHIVGQRDRQVRLRHRHDAARLAMDDRDRAAPVALARNAPVAQPVVHLPLAGAVPASRRRAISSLASATVMPVEEVAN